jgi:hypothetical protein
MINIHYSNRNTAKLKQRIERKFFVLPQNFDRALLLLRQVCSTDVEFPFERVNSLYFDTEDLDQYERSSSGEFCKNKIRIRWYHQLDAYQETVPVFVELKSREGFASTKQRCRLLVPKYQLEPVNLHQGIIPRSNLIDILASFDYYLEKPIEPIITISYWRYRFNELFTNSRLTLDYDISSTMIKQSPRSHEKELKLSGAVIELKGTSMELPLILRDMKLLDLDWSRFSKYSSCIDSHNEEIGAIGRLSPSGKIIS